MSTVSRALTGEEIDEAFEDGQDMREYFDLSAGRVREPEVRRVNVDFPAWMVTDLDREAARLAVPRQAVIKTLVDEGLRERRRELVAVS